jgi:Protein of unknown function (DUF3147)
VKRIEFNLGSLKETRAHEYLVRFVFGGFCTVIAGLVARHYGPGIGGLFLAFPAIFPASATMIENHEKKRKAEAGADGTLRGRLAAGLDASGAALGCVGLAAFALIVWRSITLHNACGAIAVAVTCWATLSYLLWAIRKTNDRDS